MSLRPIVGFVLFALVAVPSVTSFAQTDTVPYWASISTDIARMRKGPSEDMPVIWEYRREHLPVKVLVKYENWRKVQDPDGAIGWMNARLLSARRTAIVTAAKGTTRPIRTTPSPDATVAYRAQPGVVGFLSECADGWCLLDVAGKSGYIQVDHIWGD